jgi:isopentenyldiphosphate isomerase
VFEPLDSGDVRFILQLRPPDKDTSPDVWDVSVGGHYAAGEGIEGGLREMREELGIDVEATWLVQAGWRHQLVDDGSVHDHEVQDVFFLDHPLDLARLRPDPGEVPALVLISGAELRALAAGRVESVVCPGGETLPDSRVNPEPIELRADRLMPRTGDYYSRAVHFSRRLATGWRPRRRSWW